MTRFTGREFGDKSNNIYYAYTTKNPIRDCDHSGHLVRDCPEIRTVGNAMFYLGAQYAMQTSTELSPHVARFIEFMMWLTNETDQSDITNAIEVPY